MPHHGPGRQDNGNLHLNEFTIKAAPAADPAAATVADVAAARITPLESGYSLGVGGSYRLTRNLDVTGGVRYKIQRDRLEPLADQRRDSQAVYVGTAFRF